MLVLAAVAGAIGASGCGASDIGLELLVDPPRVEALAPASGVAGERVAVVIGGQALHPRVVQDVGHVSGVRVDARFSAWLGDVPLEQVTWIDPTRLEAVVPAGLVAGRHDLRVRTPNGLEASLAGAFRAIDPDPPLEVVILPQPEATSVGGVIGVRVRVTNRGSGDLLDVETRGLAAVPEGIVALAGAGVTEPVALSPGASAELAFTFVATAPGLVSFAAGAHGVDAFGNVVETPAPASSAPVEVQRAAALSLSLAAEPATVVVGGSTMIFVTVSNDGETGAAAVTPALVHDGALLSVLEGPTPSAADVPPGASASFAFTARAETSGTGLVTASAHGSDVLSWHDVDVPPSTALVTALAPPVLAGTWSVPARVSQAQAFEATLEVRNTGASGVVDLVAQVAPETSGASCEAPLPTLVASLPAGESVRFVYSCTAAADAGALVVSGAASGTRAIDGVMVPSTVWSSAAVAVERPPRLSLAWSEPEGAAAGRRYGAALTVTNVGEATALHVALGDLTVEGESGTVCGAETLPHVELEGGGAISFLLDCVAGPRTGLARLVATVSSHDINSGEFVGAAGSSDGTRVVAAAPIALLVSEVVTDPWHDWSDSDGVGTPFDHAPGHGSVDEGDEWLELYNAGVTPIDLRGLVVTLVDSSPTSFVLGATAGPPLFFSAGGGVDGLRAGEHVVVGAPGGEEGMDDDVWITVDTPEGLRADEVALGAGLGGPENVPYNAPSGTSLDVSGSIARVPLAADTGSDAADFARAPFTIGRSNDCEVRSSVFVLTASSAQADTPPLSFPHVATGVDGLVVVGVVSRSRVGEVSYGGIPLVPVEAALSDGASLWALTAPPAGEALVVVHGAPGKLAAGAVSLTGAQQADPVARVAFESGSTSSPALTLDVPAAGAAVVDVLCVKQSVVATPGGAQALAWRHVGSVGGGVGGGSSTLGPLPTPGSATLAWSLDSAGPWTWVAASFFGQCQ